MTQYNDSSDRPSQNTCGQSRDMNRKLIETHINSAQGQQWPLANEVVVKSAHLPYFSNN